MDFTLFFPFALKGKKSFLQVLVAKRPEVLCRPCTIATALCQGEQLDTVLRGTCTIIPSQLVFSYDFGTLKAAMQG